MNHANSRARAGNEGTPSEAAVAFLIEEYKQSLALRDAAMTISMNRVNIFFAVTSAAAVSVALLVDRENRVPQDQTRLVALAILAFVLILGITSFLALCEHHISRVVYLRSANYLRGEIARCLGVQAMMRLPTSEMRPPMDGTGHRTGGIALTISFPTILALVTGLVGASVVAVALQPAFGSGTAFWSAGVTLAFMVGGAFAYQTLRFRAADREYSPGPP